MTKRRQCVALVSLTVLWVAAEVRAQGNDQLLCPLSEEQQTTSQSAWALVAEAFKHERCSNCHGKVNPFSGDTHGGGQQDLEPDDAGQVNTPQSEERTFAACATCHDKLPWKLAPGKFQWWNQSVEELCKTQHRNMIFPRAFRHHSDTDELINEAFVGTLGFTSNSREEGRWPDPPPLDHATFMSRIDSWYEAQGVDSESLNKWRGDQIDCGCTPVHYEVAIEGSEAYSGIPFCSGDWQIEETIPIKFTADKQYTGTGTGTRSIPNFNCGFPGLSCTYDFAPIATTVELAGEVIEDGNGVPTNLTITGSRTSEASSVTIDCTCEDPDAECPFPITIGIPPITYDPFEVDPALDAKLGTQTRSPLKVTIRKRD